MKYTGDEAHKRARPQLQGAELTNTLAKYDVVDVGASKGTHSLPFIDSINKEFPKDAEPLRIVGLDIDPAKVATCNKGGHTCLQVDVTTLATTPAPLVTGTTLFHVLEHIGVSRNPEQRGNATLANSVLLGAGSIAKVFVYFRGPVFDGSADLQKFGFLRYYETWKGHTCWYNSTHLTKGLLAIAGNRPAKLVVALGTPIESSKHDHILPMTMPEDSFQYSHVRNDGRRDEKPRVYFGKLLKFYSLMYGLLVFDDAPREIAGKKTRIITNYLVHDILMRTADGRRIMYCSEGWELCNTKFRNHKDKRRMPKID